MAILKSIFTWWDGATIGTLLYSRRNGRKVGTDRYGNVYLESRKATDGKVRRWVIYDGPNDASRVPAEWFGWLHHQTDLTPDEMPPVHAWEKEPEPNLTGTPHAYLPAGALERGGNRAAATGDYEAWTPGA